MVENVDQVYRAAEKEGLMKLLKQSDYVVLCCEINDETYHMIGVKELACMRKETYLINLGRGQLIKEHELVHALRQGKIAGAGLDTFEQEPLSCGSPLWELPNVMITPHYTPQLPDKEERMLEFVYSNIEAYRQEGEFVNRASEKNIFRLAGK